MMRLAFIPLMIAMTSFSGVQLNQFPLDQITDIEGNEIDFTQSNYPYTYVTVWASWCKPCRKHNVELMRLLEDSLVRTKIRPLFISMDGDSLVWRKAMRNDGVPAHGSMWSREGLRGPLAQKLGVSGLPAHFLLNDSGYILSSDCSPLRLMEYINR